MLARTRTEERFRRRFHQGTATPPVPVAGLNLFHDTSTDKYYLVTQTPDGQRLRIQVTLTGDAVGEGGAGLPYTRSASATPTGASVPEYPHIYVYNRQASGKRDVVSISVQQDDASWVYMRLPV